MQHSFLNDYSEGCHPEILERLSRFNTSQALGYGGDDYCQNAADTLRERMGTPLADVHFISGGTQANLVCIAAMLKPFEAIIAPTTGHIAANEAGAIEATGHKIVTVPAVEGKLCVADIEQALGQFSLHPHMVRIKAVYITNATELGTVYRLDELEAIHACCQRHGLYLLIDGARLGAALASDSNDVTLGDVARLADIFWLGGTKNGALFGEAIVITHDALKADFGFHLKQHGALLAKGRALGIQFAALLEQDRYLSLAAHANAMARRLSDGLVACGCRLSAPTQTNQVFVELASSLCEHLAEDFGFLVWQRQESGHVLVRLVTSWATPEAAVDALLARAQTHLAS